MNENIILLITCNIIIIHEFGDNTCFLAFYFFIASTSTGRKANIFFNFR